MPSQISPVGMHTGHPSSMWPSQSSSSPLLQVSTTWVGLGSQTPFGPPVHLPLTVAPTELTSVESVWTGWTAQGGVELVPASQSTPVPSARHLSAPVTRHTPSSLLLHGWFLVGKSSSTATSQSSSRSLQLSERT